MSRQDALRDTVIEAARHYVAAHLVAERAAFRLSPERPGSADEYHAAVGLLDDALQTLRDSCQLERSARSDRC